MIAYLLLLSIIILEDENITVAEIQDACLQVRTVCSNLGQRCFNGNSTVLCQDMSHAVTLPSW